MKRITKLKYFAIGFTTILLFPFWLLIYFIDWTYMQFAELGEVVVDCYKEAKNE